MNCKGEFDSGFALTPNSVGCLDSWPVGTVSTVSRFVDMEELLKQFGSPRSTSHPSEEWC